MLPRLRQLIDRIIELPEEDQELICEAIELQLKRVEAGLISSGRQLSIMDLAFGVNRLEIVGKGRG